MARETANVKTQDAMVDIKTTGVVADAEVVNQWAEFEVEVQCCCYGRGAMLLFLDGF